MRFIGVFLLLASTPAFAWAPEGHQIVAGIAARELTPKGRAQVSSLLGGEAGAMMVQQSSWADEIRQQRPETLAWHYVNIKTGSSGYLAARDCPHDDCVVRQIELDAALGDDSERIAAEIEAHLTPGQKMQIETGTPADWANESFALAEREIYVPLPVSGRITLPPDYARRESGVARQQLTKAGLRLAMMLNRIFR